MVPPRWRFDLEFDLASSICKVAGSSGSNFVSWTKIQSCLLSVLRLIVDSKDHAISNLTFKASFAANAQSWSAKTANATICKFAPRQGSKN